MTWSSPRLATLLLHIAFILAWGVARLLLFLFSPLFPLPSPAPPPARPRSLRPPEDPELAGRLDSLAKETNSLLRLLIKMRTERSPSPAPELETDTEDEASEEEAPPSLVSITSERMRRYNTTMFQWAWDRHPELSSVNSWREQSGLQRRRLSCLPREGSHTENTAHTHRHCNHLHHLHHPHQQHHQQLHCHQHQHQQTYSQHH